MSVAYITSILAASDGTAVSLCGGRGTINPWQALLRLLILLFWLTLTLLLAGGCAVPTTPAPYPSSSVLAQRASSTPADMPASPAAAPPAPDQRHRGGTLGSFTSVTVTLSGESGLLNVGSSRSFTATVLNTTNTAVSWSVVEPDGGSITPEGVYTAPPLPGTFTVKAVSLADSHAFASVRVPVVIPVGHIPGYDVGVDYHATGTDFLHTAFLMNYNQASVRAAVQQQLQGMADRGATIIFTRIWMVTNPGDTDFGESWRTHFPLADQEQQNLHSYAQDVASVRGSGGNRLRLWICLLWLGASDYTVGSPATTLGYSNLTATEFTSRVKTTIDEVVTALQGVARPDGIPVADRIYMDGEVMIGAKANQDWFLATHYPYFLQDVTAAGFRPTVYFIVADTQADLLDNNYTDADYPILNNHRSMFWMYRSLKFMADQGLPIPSRIDFSYYISDPTGAPFATITARVLDDADAVLPSLGAPQSYFFAETSYFQDDAERYALGQAIAEQAVANSRLTGVCFWTTPDGGGAGVNIAYPFAIEDYFPPPM